MADETKPAANTQPNPDAKQPEGNPPEGSKPSKPAAKVAPKLEIPVLAIGEPSGNLTRDSIIEFQRAKLIEQGRSEEDAHKLAVKRGYEMIRE